METLKDLAIYALPIMAAALYYVVGRKSSLPDLIAENALIIDAPDTLGFRNKNVGNIKYSDSNDWLGQVGEGEMGFAEFIDYSYGIRAMGILLSSYRSQGFITIEDMINRYAPTSDDNPTKSYAQFVADRIGSAVTYRPVPKDYPFIISAMIHFENGSNPFTLDYIDNSLRLTE